VTDDVLSIPVVVASENIDVFNKIIEAYDNLALVTTVNPEEGRLIVWVTPDTRSDVIKILQHMPFPVEVKT